MIKKIVAVVLVLVVVGLASFRLFFHQDNTTKKLTDLKENLSSYHMEANMEISRNDDLREFLVVVDFNKKEEKNYFRISLLDKNINQEQIMLRNEKGVFVLTPSLNQVYTFSGDYPLNSQKPYLFHSMLEALDGDYDLEKSSDGYILTYNPKYENNTNWVKEDIKLSKDFKPVWVNIYDQNNTVVCKVNFTKVEFDNQFEDDFFNVEKNMDKARETSTAIDRNEDELPFMVVDNLIASELAEQVEATVDGKTVYILSYTGDKNFTLIQEVIEEQEEITYLEVSGNLVNFDLGLGIYNDKYLVYIYNGIKYEVYSDSLKVDEMIDIVSTLDVIEK